VQLALFGTGGLLPEIRNVMLPQLRCRLTISVCSSRPDAVWYCRVCVPVLTGWLLGRTQPLRIFGPSGITAIVNALLQHIYDRDITFREGKGDGATSGATDCTAGHPPRIGRQLSASGSHSVWAAELFPRQRIW
jgi:hypothetical protein